MLDDYVIGSAIPVSIKDPVYDAVNKILRDFEKKCIVKITEIMAAQSKEMKILKTDNSALLAIIGELQEKINALEAKVQALCLSQSPCL